MNLLSVNRNEEDIIWRKDLNQLAEKEKSWVLVIFEILT